MTSVVAEVIARIVFFIGLSFSITLMLAGHNQPGGGFIGGAMAASLFLLLYIVFGRAWLRQRFRGDYLRVVAAGLAIVASMAMLPLLYGQPVLTALAGAFEVPLHGPVKVSTGVIFDFGVFLTVAGSALTILTSTEDR